MRDWSGTRVQEDALSVVCPDCKAAIGAPCVNEITTKPLEHFPAHEKRIRLGQKGKQHA